MSKVYIYPTDTVWGIGSNPFELSSYETISRIKNTQPNKPLSLLTNSVDNIISKMTQSDYQEELLVKLFKNKITIGIPKNIIDIEIPEVISSQSDFICFRVIDDAVIEECTNNSFGFITTTSLNISGEESITSADKAHEFWSKYCPEAVLLESNTLRPSGQSSTIIILSGMSVKVLREGSDIDNITSILKEYGFEL